MLCFMCDRRLYLSLALNAGFSRNQNGVFGLRLVLQLLQKWYNIGYEAVGLSHFLALSAPLHLLKVPPKENWLVMVGYLILVCPLFCLFELVEILLVSVR